MDTELSSPSLHATIGTLLRHGVCKSCGEPLTSLSGQGCRHVVDGVAMRNGLDEAMAALERIQIDVSISVPVPASPS